MMTIFKTIEAGVRAPFREMSKYEDMNQYEVMCALVSNESYSQIGRRASNLTAKGSLQATLDTSIGTWDACVYTSKDRSCVLVGFKGTEPTNANDLARDAGIVMCYTPFTRPQELMKEIHSKHPLLTTLMCTGHSLGGAKAAQAGEWAAKYLKMNVRLEIFNSAPFAFSCVYDRALGHEIPCMHHHVKYDLISAGLQSNFGYDLLKQKTYDRREGIDGYHTLANFLPTN
eukprot:gb/GFBE01078598.1/.p1 GENE.gb/GFBE01078598.1/~~gb/GFBE01078598.1/.p1  ORF type:complete len:229 (+),score=35.36 gb/GFBE01078598.1/:1-687(+)